MQVFLLQIRALLKVGSTGSRRRSSREDRQTTVAKRHPTLGYITLMVGHRVRSQEQYPGRLGGQETRFLRQDHGCGDGERRLAANRLRNARSKRGRDGHCGKSTVEP